MLSKSLKKYLIPFVFCVFCFFSACKNDFASDYSLEILSPKENWTYTTDSEILFSCNVKGDGLVWESSVEGEIGNGLNFLKNFVQELIKLH